MFAKTKGWDTGVARGKLLLSWGLARGELEINDKLIEALYQCPTCMLCEQECTAGAKVTEIIREARALIVERGVSVPFSHKGTFDTVARITLRDGLHRDWLDLIRGDFRENGEIVYFPGSLPYLEPILDFDLGAAEITSAAVKIFNHAGIRPAIITQLADSGHDAFWSGQYQFFNALKEKNSRLLAGTKMIVITCAEDYCILKSEYSLEAEVYHISQFVRNAIREGKLAFSKGEEKITFHDPCRLGRHTGEYDAPREVLKTFADYREMARYGKNAVCCGVGAWMNCNKYSKQLRLDRVKEAAEVADTLITACSKCLSHFSCLIHEPEKVEDLPDIKVVDFTEFVARNLKDL
jgi:Fe-S oxidoreductase